MELLCACSLYRCPARSLLTRRCRGYVACRSTRLSSLHVQAFHRSPKRAKYSGNGAGKEPKYIEMDSEGSNLWKLDEVATMLQNGGVGIIPTDTFPAIVCDVRNQAAVMRLCEAKHIRPSKPLSILVRSFHDIDTYTQGLPVSNAPGQPDLFRILRRVLPGPYTLILRASKSLPKQVLDQDRHKSKQRKTVGVRMPDHIITKALLERVEAPLLATSAHVGEDDELRVEIPDAATMMDLYPDVDFVIDEGQRIVQGSTVVDLTTADAKILRQGLGDPSVFEAALV